MPRYKTKSDVLIDKKLAGKVRQHWANQPNPQAFRSPETLYQIELPKGVMVYAWESQLALPMTPAEEDVAYLVRGIKSVIEDSIGTVGYVGPGAGCGVCLREARSGALIQHDEDCPIGKLQNLIAPGKLKAMPRYE